VAEDEQFSLDENSQNFTLGGHQARITGRGHEYLLRIQDFPTPDAARDFFYRLRGALLVATLDLRIGLSIVAELQEPLTYDPPKEIKAPKVMPSCVRDRGWTHVDAAIDASPSVVIPEHKRVLLFAAGSATAIRGVTATRLADTLDEALGLPNPEQIATAERLSLAIDLYAASRREATHRGRIVTMVTALEALVDAEYASDRVRASVDRILVEFRTTSSHTTIWRRFAYWALRRMGILGRMGEGLTGAERNRLMSQLGNLRRESIGERLRRFVEAESAHLGADGDELKRALTHSYGVRSHLVHEGHSDPRDVERARTWLEMWVPKLLRSVANRSGGLAGTTTPAD
jgi:hypothetical protein